MTRRAMVVILVGVVTLASVLLAWYVPSTQLWSHNGTSAMLVLRCEPSGLSFYAVTPGTWGLSRGERTMALLGFRFEQSAYVVGRSFELTIPSWTWILCAAAIPAFVIEHHFRKHRAVPPGHCTRCGYDLRATPDRCPECGAASEVSMGNGSSRPSSAATSAK